MTLTNLKKEIKSLANPIYAKNLAWFFKTREGEYGEGDKFLGLQVPVCRTVAKKYITMELAGVSKLIQSKYHEERLIALLILVEKYKRLDKPDKSPEGKRFQKSAEAEKTKIYKFYLANTKWVNNWDLVDLSCHHIVGAYLISHHDQDKAKVLIKLAKSKNLWERRIAIISTFEFIKEADFTTSMNLAEILLHDTHDLIHKAVGWMLREVGKRSITDLTPFLQKHYKTMPRTMLRYAIEKFPEEIRQAYLHGTI